MSSTKSRSVYLVSPRLVPTIARPVVQFSSLSITTLKASGARTHPWQTPVSTGNHSVREPSCLMQLSVSWWRTWNNRTSLVVITITWHSLESALLSTESNAALRSMYAAYSGWELRRDQQWSGQGWVRSFLFFVFAVWLTSYGLKVHVQMSSPGQMWEWFRNSLSTQLLILFFCKVAGICFFSSLQVRFLNPTSP